MEEWLLTRYILSVGAALSMALFWTANVWPFYGALLDLVRPVSNLAVCLTQIPILGCFFHAVNHHKLSPKTALLVVFCNVLSALISADVARQGVEAEAKSYYDSHDSWLYAQYKINGRFLAVVLFAATCANYFIAAFDIDATYARSANTLHELSKRHQLQRLPQSTRGASGADAAFEVAAPRGDVLQPDQPSPPASETQPDGGVPAAPAAGVRRSARSSSAKVKAR